MNADQRAAALARCEQATPGPWSVGERTTDVHSAAKWVGGGVDWEYNDAPDAEFVAHCRSDLPAALAALVVAEQRMQEAVTWYEERGRWAEVAVLRDIFDLPLRAALGGDKQGEPE